jgi:hypothetical protein
MKAITNEPKNANDASRFFRTATYAAKIVAEGLYQFEQDAETKTVYVMKPGRLAASYTITEEDGCDCPNFLEHGGYCKHTLAWAEIKENAKMWEAICSEVEEQAKREIFA